jgi:nitroreductase
METKDAIKLRRSVKYYDPSHKLTQNEITELLSLTALSPTAFNIQHWRFVVVKDPELRNEIRKVAWDQAQVTDSSLLLILCADLKAWEKSPHRYWQNSTLYYLPLIAIIVEKTRYKEMKQCDLAVLQLKR